MIRVAETRADFERCAEIYNAVEPDRVLTAEEAASGNGTSLLHEGGGFAFIGPSSVTGSAFGMVRVHPDARGHVKLLARRRKARAEHDCGGGHGQDEIVLPIHQPHAGGEE